jgi:uncharacterized protein (TIGR03000 family)
MSKIWSIRLGLVVVFASLTSGQASAQIFGGFPNYGLYNFGGSAPYIGGGMRSYNPGMYSPYPYFPYYSTSYASTFTVPGWAANGYARSVPPAQAAARPTQYPAVALPASSPLLQVEAQSGTRAGLAITVPNAQALVWIEGTMMNQTGTMRRFTTPQLQLGKDYSYDIAVRWTDSQGELRTARRTVTFQAGDEVPVTFR